MITNLILSLKYGGDFSSLLPQICSLYKVGKCSFFSVFFFGGFIFFLFLFFGYMCLFIENFESTEQYKEPEKKNITHNSTTWVHHFGICPSNLFSKHFM